MSRSRPITAVQIARTTFALAGGMLLAFVVLANSVQAGCGDYVLVRNASGQLVRASTLMKDHGTCTGPHCPDFKSPAAESNDAALASQTENIPVKPPCNGPNCSNRSELPAAPVPPAPPRSVQESTALLLPFNDRDREAGARFSVASSSHDHELHYPQSIFHPPR